MVCFQTVLNSVTIANSVEVTRQFLKCYFLRRRNYNSDCQVIYQYSLMYSVFIPLIVSQCLGTLLKTEVLLPQVLYKGNEKVGEGRDSLCS